MALAERIQAPIAVTIAAKPVIDETFAHYGMKAARGRAEHAAVDSPLPTADPATSTNGEESEM
jgi:hypothetical protein